jgi:hypothetical protein
MVSPPLTRAAAIVLLGAAFGGPGCGGGDGDTGDGANTGVDTTAQPAAPGREAMTAGALKYCVEGAGAQAAKPADEGDVEGAKRELVISWPDTKHSADIYFTADDAEAQSAADKLDADRHARRDGNVIIVPDAGRPPDSVEALLIDDCIP